MKRKKKKPRGCMLPRFESRRPGRGFHMDAVTLYTLTKLSYVLNAAELEREYGVKHGTASRLLPVAKSLGFNTKEDLEKVTPAEYHKLRYARKSHAVCENGAVQEFLQPDYDLLSNELQKYEQEATTKTAKKTIPTREYIVNKFYYSNENKMKASSEGKLLYKNDTVLKKWSLHSRCIPAEFKRRHVYGQEAQMDFCGATIPWTKDGKNNEATILVVVFPASRYIGVQAIDSQKSKDVLDGLNTIFMRFGGVPNGLVVDNFKGAVVSAHKSGGELNDKMYSFCKFYNMDIFPCRPHDPQGKGTVEAHVKIVNRQVIAPARNCDTVFNSIKDINDFIQPLVEEVNNKKIRGLNTTRNELFKNNELPVLNIPNSWNFSQVECFSVNVPQDGCILLGKHHYAVPESYIGDNIDIELDLKTVRIFNNNRLIVAYPKKEEKGLSSKEGFTSERMLAIWIYETDKKEMLLEWAKQIGEETFRWACDMLKKDFRHADHALRVVKVLSLADGHKKIYYYIEETIKELRSRPSGKDIQPGEICRRFNELNVEFEGPKDEIYNPEVFYQVARNYVYGLIPSLQWPSNAKIEETRTYVNSSTGEFLNGQNTYEKRYEAIIDKMREIDGGK